MNHPEPEVPSSHFYTGAVSCGTARTHPSGRGCRRRRICAEAHQRYGLAVATTTSRSLRGMFLFLKPLRVA
jgi:hypothetical protein